MAADAWSTALMIAGPEAGQEILRAITMLIEHRISGAPVVDERGNLVGACSPSRTACAWC